MTSRLRRDPAGTVIGVLAAVLIWLGVAGLVFAVLEAGRRLLMGGRP